jgi:hypothetical protein
MGYRNDGSDAEYDYLIVALRRSLGWHMSLSLAVLVIALAIEF